MVKTGGSTLGDPQAPEITPFLQGVGAFVKTSVQVIHVFNQFPVATIVARRCCWAISDSLETKWFWTSLWIRCDLVSCDFLWEPVSCRATTRGVDSPCGLSQVLWK